MADISGTSAADSLSNETTPSIFHVEYIDVDGRTNNTEASDLNTYFDTETGEIAVSQGDKADSGATIRVNPFGTADSNDLNPEQMNSEIGYNDTYGHATRFTTKLATDGGEYTFDGEFYNSAALYVDGKMVFLSENVGDGEASGTIELGAGVHDVVVIYAKDRTTEKDDLDINISGGEFGKTPILLQSCGAVGPLVGDDIINSGAGADVIDASHGDDLITAGTGNDTVQSGDGDDTVYGGDGNDTLIGDDQPSTEPNNLLTNGSFEADAISGSWSYGGNLTGWQRTGAATETWQSGQVYNGTKASDGNQHLELDAGRNSQDGVYQDVQTEDGTIYSLSLDIAKRIGTSSHTNTVEIVWNGEVIATIDPTETDFTTFNFELTGTGGQDRLTLREEGGDDDSLGGLIDNVILTGPPVTHNDKLVGEDGPDSISGEQGNDLLVGGKVGTEWSLVDGEWVYDPTALKSGGDAVALDKSADTIDGGIGNDVLLGGGGNDVLMAGAGDDVINAGTDDDVAYGGDGNDTLNLEDGNDMAKAGAGDDIVNAGTGNDVAHGEDGNDQLRGGDGADQLFGGEGSDVLHGGDGDDALDGGTGADKLFGGEGDDQLFGGDGKDYLDSGAGDDVLSGGAGDDMLKGGSGDDHLSGGEGNDKLIGGTGSDTIEGGAGNDHLWGGNWSADGTSDTFVVSAGSGKDMIHDFEADNDVIDLSSYGLQYSDIAALITDKGWATEIDLSGLTGGGSEDKLILKSIGANDLDESNFVL
jgi:Ca2+-binding RTX toxin-like protein